ncbi:aldose 1-epimerase family protein [Lentilactobacillus sp. Marseille-Q4993]|uniref:aldose 1-epimerase family protein n=1 Tax=Lentilactobacillus sp. Marseille-Q4993 TaxID=3039492 RepID=UPI0024BC00D7|nr:aldose 1-epimerase family protein [Lentilactobacillus sp. Marseille-Q4993]
MQTLKNEYLTVTINEHGAELTSVIGDGIEYMWQADPEYWKRHAPILFPIVGRLKDNQFEYQGKIYSMSQHGFARDRDFTVTDKSNTSVEFQLVSDDQTREVYPFDFELNVKFDLSDHQLSERITLINKTDGEILFQIGAHPGFNVPLTDEGSFNDYFVSVAPKGKYEKTPLKPPYSDPNDVSELDFSKPKYLDHEWFNSDAQVLNLKNKPTTVMLSNNSNDHGVSLHLEDAPFVGIWSPYPKESPFACIEPWWGLADTVDATGKLDDKFAINKLTNKDEQFTASFELTFF